MRNLQRNKQELYYALYKGKETIYKLDENGQKIVAWVDESQNPPVTYYEEDGTKDVYENAVKFKGNIAMSKGDAQAVDYGVSEGDYEAILMTEKNCIPITETSLIWFETVPTMGADGYVDDATADYRVIKLKPSLNQDRYVLAKVVK